MPSSHWIDRLTAGIAPRWTMQRIRSRMALELLARHYEGAATGRRTQGWRRTSGDANAAVSSGLSRLREHARDLARNNPFAAAALDTIVDHTVGYGITGKPSGPELSSTRRSQALETWKRWAETTACDADGRHDFAGLQKLVMRTVVESGEVLVRRRFRRPDDGLPIPLQLQVLEPDYLDASLGDAVLPNGGRRIQGIEFDPIGRRVAYRLFGDHPGSSLGMVGPSGAASVPATEILHIFKVSRPGQVRGPSWFAPVILRLKDFDEYEDAALMKQKIAACLAVITTDIDGSGTALGATDAATPEIDSLEPGMIANIAAGRQVTVVDPPAVSEHAAYSQTVLRAIAAGLGVTYEDLVGDYTNMPFSAARMSRLRHWARVDDWRWRMLIPQFCDPVWSWAMQAAVIAGAIPVAPDAEWTAPPMPMIEPDKEGLAYQRNIRSGIQTLSEAIRERGYDPQSLLREMATDNQLLDQLGLRLDSDGRYMTQAGQLQSTTPAVPGLVPAPVSGNGRGHQRAEVS